MTAIVVDDVSKKFRLQTDRAHSVKELVTRRDRNAGVDQFWALRNVSLEIPEGSMYALIGHNGCGKSTLLRCIAGIYRPTEGRVTANGRISTLLELGAGFHPDLTGRENVYMNATILGLTKKEIDRSFDSIVDFAGIEEFIDSPVKIYSSGMYIRLGFSVAVHVDPEILIVDEVIAVGDEEFQRKCFDHLYGLRKQGVTIVVVTHGMGTVETMCDGATWLDHGVVVKSGPAAAVAHAYLKQVNDREMDARAQQRASSLDEAEAEAEPEGDGPVDLREAWFGEDIEIVGARFLDGHGNEATTVRSGDPVVLQISYSAHRAVERPVFGYAIHTENDVHIAGSNTKLDGHETGVVDGEGTIEWVLDELPLLPGNYEFTIGINDQFVQHTFDRRLREYPLVVRRGPRTPGAGIVSMGGRWRLPGVGVAR